MPAAAVSSIPVKNRRLKAPLEPVVIERRLRVRFPLELLVRYRTLDRPRPLTGRGSIMNISSGGVLVASQNEIGAGIEVELSIEWPFLLDGRVPLQLVAAGKVVRCDTSSFALLLTRHQFRTSGRAISCPSSHLMVMPAIREPGGLQAP
jgi:hypothetical protein